MPETLLDQLPWQTLNGTALTNSTTATDIAPQPAMTILNSYWFPGFVLRFTAAGVMSTASAAPGTLTLWLNMSATSGVTISSANNNLLTVLNAVTPTVSAANWRWRIEATVRCVILGAGSTAAWVTEGKFYNPTSATAFSPVLSPAAGALANTTGSGMATTVTNSIGLGAAWGTASASNSIQVSHWEVEALNPLGA